MKLRSKRHKTLHKISGNLWNYWFHSFIYFLKDCHNLDRDNSLLETAQTWEFYWLVGSIHSCVSSLKHIHFAIINHFLFNCNVSKMAAHSERKTQTANFRAVQNFAKSNWQETAQLHTFAHSVTNIQFTFLELFHT